MYSFLPNLSPRDCHSLWYTSSRNPVQPAALVDVNLFGHGHVEYNEGGSGANGGRRPGQALLERSQLARLRADEQYLERRRLNVQNFGSTWLKPPGVAKTLHQIREEKREQEEHQEALRREQLAQELADAEAIDADGLLQGEGMDDIQLDGARDLDDDIPDADAADFGVEVDEDADEAEAEAADETIEEIQRLEHHNDLMAARMRMTDDAFREALARGNTDGEDMYGAEEELEEEDRGHMLDEEDLVHIGAQDLVGDMDMDANLDDDIPEAEESGGYEHTDTEAELSSSSSSEDDGPDPGFAPGFNPRAAPLAPPQSPLLRSRGSGGRSSMDLSSILSRDESSVMERSSPPARPGGSTRQ